MTVEEDTGDIFVLDSHYQNFVGERPRVLQLRFDDADQAVRDQSTPGRPCLTNTPIPDNGDDVADPNECPNPLGCDPRMYGIDIVTRPAADGRLDLRDRRLEPAELPLPQDQPPAFSPTAPRRTTSTRSVPARTAVTTVASS